MATMRYCDIIKETREFVASTNERLDKFLCRIVPEFSRSFLQQLIVDGLITVNAAPRKAGQKVRAGEKVVLNIPQPIALSAEPENIPLTVLYEDTEIIVIDKLAGIAVHPSAGHESGTLVNALLGHCRESLSGIGGELRPGIVHRLDMDTSGCIVVAKTDHAHRDLSAQFAARTVDKKYLALTHLLSSAHIPASGKVEGGIMRNPDDWARLRFAPSISADSAAGKYSLTFYEIRENFGDFALIECVLKTGRTHQIRLHLNAIGAPILADAFYGRESAIFYTNLLTSQKSGVNKAKSTNRKSLVKTKLGNEQDAELPLLSRQALHAAFLAFVHPLTKARIEFSSPLPSDMQSTLQILRDHYRPQK